VTDPPAAALTTKITATTATAHRTTVANAHALLIADPAITATIATTATGHIIATAATTAPAATTAATVTTPRTVITLITTIVTSNDTTTTHQARIRRIAIRAATAPTTTGIDLQNQVITTTKSITIINALAAAIPRMLDSDPTAAPRMDLKNPDPGSIPLA